MTMVSFRVGEQDAEELRRWASELGVDRSELLRDAVHRHLVQLRSERETTSWLATPMTDSERSLGEIAAWGPAEDWSDWDDGTR